MFQHIIPIAKRVLLACIASIALVLLVRAFTDRALVPMTFSNRRIEAAVSRTGGWPSYDYAFDGSTSVFVFGPRGSLSGPRLSEAFDLAQQNKTVAIYVPNGDWPDSYGTYVHPFFAFLWNLMWPSFKCASFFIILLIVIYWWTDIREP